MTWIDSAQRVKRAPRKWEQDLLSSARTGGGQAAVDKVAEAIARYNDRCIMRFKRMELASTWKEKKQIAEEAEADQRAIMLAGVFDEVSRDG